MKNLLKVTMSLAMVVLLSVSVFAQQTETGTCTVEVLSGVEFCQQNVYDVHFVYDAFNGNSELAKTMTLLLQANDDWMLDITATLGANPGVFVLDDVTVDGNLLSAVPTITGISGAHVITLPWQLVKPLDPTVAPDTYTIADVTFTLSLVP